MNDNSGGPSSRERQRQTAAEIARKRVLNSYANQPANENHATKTSKNITPEEWQKYHTAWQNYYQRYYSEYYSKAARNYVATQKFKAERARDDDAKLLEGTPVQPVEKRTNNLYSGSAANRAETEHDIKTKLRAHIRAEATKQAKSTKRHRKLIPIFAGIAVVLVFLFLQYNRMIFAPIAAYISPGNNEATSITPVDPTANIAVSADPKLIIPKLNVDVPVHFGISNDTATINNAMNNGVAHFMVPGASALPGQVGNLVISGHSAGDVYSNNQYKFIFSGLERLDTGDTIYINYNSKRYTYSVTTKDVVEPTNVAALTTAVTKPTLTLVTCTPLGTSRYRLLVHADQIDPVPDGNAPTETPIIAPSNDNQLPSNAPTFFESIWDTLFGDN